MHKLLILIIMICLTMQLAGQKTYHYYGPNGRPLQYMEEAITYKLVHQKSEHKYVVKSFNRNNDGWALMLREKIRIGEDNDQQIHYYAENFFPKKKTREMEKVEENRFKFIEKENGHTLITGESSAFIPLHLEGIVTEYYPNNAVKSVSQYHDNQLISNENWLSGGTKYIDNIFYSVDKEPTFEYGDEFFKGYMVEKLRESKIDLSQIQDNIIIGWVIMKDGTLDGVVVLRGKVAPLCKVLAEAISDLPGSWQPAVLGDSVVRYFMSLPFNFSQNNVRFQEIDISGGVMHYNSY